MIAEGRFNPLHPSSRAAIDRLQAFHAAASLCSGRHFRILALNDGAVGYHDLSLRSRSVTHAFLKKSFELHRKINEVDQGNNNPGARMIIAVGFRLRDPRRKNYDKSHLESILARLESGIITNYQAIREAYRSRSNFDIVPELQANFAFTKAYVADSDGSRAGLKGPLCFVDMSLFDDESPNWLELGDKVKWSNDRLNLSGVFAPILSFKEAHFPAGGPLDIRDGLQIAEALSNDQDVLRALHESSRAYRTQRVIAETKSGADE